VLGILSVHKGQMEAGSSLGLQRGSTLRLIVVPQALRVILPRSPTSISISPKTRSLAVAIGYPDLVSVFAGDDAQPDRTGDRDHLDHHGVYLLTSLITSAIMSFLRMAARPESRPMSDISTHLSSVRNGSRAARFRSDHRLCRFLRTRLFNSPTNILVTILGLLLLVVYPSFRRSGFFWSMRSGPARTATPVLQRVPGTRSARCWPFIRRKSPSSCTDSTRCELCGRTYIFLGAFCCCRSDSATAGQGA